MVRLYSSIEPMRLSDMNSKQLALTISRHDQDFGSNQHKNTQMWSAGVEIESAGLHKAERGSDKLEVGIISVVCCDV